jgi:hypothetical protein
LLGGIVPFLLFNSAITELTASRAGLIGVLVPVVGTAASILLLGEHITALALVGGFLALIAAVMAARRNDNPRPSQEDVVASDVARSSIADVDAPSVVIASCAVPAAGQEAS